jgi:hypothetical protein
MKSLIRALPILLLAAMVAVLYTHREIVAPSVPPPTERASDVRALQEQRERIDAQLDLLQQRHEIFLPRGIGSVAGNYMPVPNHAQPAATHNN